MKLIAVHTIHGRKVTRERDPADRKDRGDSIAITAKPNEEFDTAEFGISDEEAQALIASGAAKRRMREMTEADEQRAARRGAAQA
jgi:hypothetical protein